MPDGWLGILSFTTDSADTAVTATGSHKATSPGVYNSSRLDYCNAVLSSVTEFWQGHCGACRRKWRLTDTDLCLCGETQTMSHIVESCPLTKLNGGLSRLHSVDEDAVSWLTSYGSWHTYEKRRLNSNSAQNVATRLIMQTGQHEHISVFCKNYTGGWCHMDFNLAKRSRHCTIACRRTYEMCPSLCLMSVIIFARLVRGCVIQQTRTWLGDGCLMSPDSSCKTTCQFHCIQLTVLYSSGDSWRHSCSLSGDSWRHICSLSGDS